MNEVSGGFALVIDFGFVLCMVALLVLLIRQFRQTNRHDD